MNNYIKMLSVVIFLSVIASQVQANTRGDKGQGHQRPDFSSLDTNSDGKIDFDEFSTQKLQGGDHQTIFDSIDTDSNGSLSSDEFNNHKPPRRR